MKNTRRLKASLNLIEGSSFSILHPSLVPRQRDEKSGQAIHGTRRTSLPLLPSGPGGVHAPAHAWRLADADHARKGSTCKPFFRVTIAASVAGQL